MKAGGVRKLDPVSRSEGALGDAHTLDPVDSISSWLAAIRSNGVQQEIAGTRAPQRIRLNSSVRAVVAKLDAEAVCGSDWMKWGDELQGTITAETAAMYASSIDPLAWANETLQITRRLYKELDSDDLAAPYYEKNLPVVEDQLQRAGVRLATMLNAMFAPAPASQPAAAPTVSSPSPSESGRQ